MINSLHVSPSFSIYYFCYCCSCKFINFLNMFSGTTIREWDLQKYQFMVFLISMYDTPEYRFLWPLFFHIRTGFSDFVFTWKNLGQRTPVFWDILKNKMWHVKTDVKQCKACNDTFYIKLFLQWQTLHFYIICCY